MAIEPNKPKQSKSGGGWARSEMTPPTILLDLPACREIIARTGLKAARDADWRLKSDVNAALQLLIPRLRGVPISSTNDQRTDAANLRAATGRLLKRLGFDQYRPERGTGTPKWPWPVTFIQSDITELAPVAFEARMTNLVDEVFWLRSEVEALERVLHGDINLIPAPNYDLKGSAYTRDFFFGLFGTYRAIFNRRPAPSRGADAGPAGPTHRFVEAVLDAIREKQLWAILRTSHKTSRCNICNTPPRAGFGNIAVK